ncbi:MAG: glycosyltransferase family 2 protein [Thiohalomonas sp.]|nr:glycosyltransferase family 2 protein [Thiohalomonas sp.]
MSPKVYIVILNWNGWKNTIECLESVYRQDYENYKVIVCDNDSDDQSIKHIQAWAEGKEKLNLSSNSSLYSLTSTPVKKTINTQVIDREKAESGEMTNETQAELILIKTGGNLGFAGGNNVGLRYAQKQDDFDYVWLLNNDTVIEGDCLSNMVNYSTNYPEKNICGSMLIFYDDPTIIQALGGNGYNKWTGNASTTYGRGKSVHEKIDHKYYENQLAYITAASWLLPKSFLQEIGLMEESYFLYYEEIDWCIRNNDKYKLCYAPDAKVYHKEGSSIGSPTGERPSSILSDFYLFRNKLKLTKRYFPEALLTTYLSTFLQVINRMRRGQWDKAKLILKILFGKNTLSH